MGAISIPNALAQAVLPFSQSQSCCHVLAIVIFNVLVGCLVRGPFHHDRSGFSHPDSCRQHAERRSDLDCQVASIIHELAFPDTSDGLQEVHAAF